MSSRTRALLLAAHLVALWPTVLWWGHRVAGETDEIWGALAWPLSLLLLMQSPARECKPLALPALGLLAYVASQGLVPPLISAGLGTLSFAATLSALYLGRHLSAPLAAALLLGLPVEASLQFYLGYPLRFVVASVAAPMLSTLGLDVVAMGTQLSWNSLSVAVDGPCSGVRMLRTALLFSSLLVLLDRRGLGALSAHLLFALAALVLANVLRATSLFLIELTEPPFPWLHAAVGVCAFSMLLAAQYTAHRWSAPGPSGATA